MDMDVISGRDVESQIERKLSKIPPQKNSMQKKAQGGLSSLLVPLKLEMLVAKDIIIIIRQNEMRKLLYEEFRQHNEELSAMGLSLQQYDWL